MRGIEQIEERGRDVKPGETGAKNRKSGNRLKLSLRGNVEIQAQHSLDRCVNRVRKPVRNKRPDRCVNWEAAVKQIFREGIYLGVSVGAHL